MRYEEFDWLPREEVVETEEEEIDDEIIIATRHTGMVEWLQKQGIRGRVVRYLDPEVARNRIVIGNPPLFVAANATEVWAVEFGNRGKEYRKRSLSCADMERCNALIRRYKVECLGRLFPRKGKKKGE